MWNLKVFKPLVQISLAGFSLFVGSSAFAHSQTGELKLGDRIDCVDVFERDNGASIPGKRNLSGTIKREIVLVPGSYLGAGYTPVEREQVRFGDNEADRRHYKYVVTARSTADLTTMSDALVEILVFTPEKTLRAQFYYGRDDFNQPLTARVALTDVPGAPETVAYTVHCQIVRN